MNYNQKIFTYLGGTSAPINVSPYYPNNQIVLNGGLTTDDIEISVKYRNSDSFQEEELQPGKVSFSLRGFMVEQFIISGADAGEYQIVIHQFD